MKICEEAREKEKKQQIDKKIIQKNGFKILNRLGLLEKSVKYFLENEEKEFRKEKIIAFEEEINIMTEEVKKAFKEILNLK